MGKKKHESALKGVKKLSKVTPQAACEKQRNFPKLPKDGPSFLKQRMGKKVRDLRSPHAEANTLKGAAVNFASIQQEAAHRGDTFEAEGGFDVEEEEEAGAANRGTEAENTRRRFYSELRRVLAAADVIIEVLDARDPGSCRCISLEKEVSDSGKRLVLLLNKIDLVPKHAVEAWMNHLKRSFPVIAFKAAQVHAQRPVHAMTSASRAPEGLLRSTHAVVGADELMQLLKNYARLRGSKSKAHLSVGIVGYPNTGKSSVINSMKRHAAVEVGGKAGVTKAMQEVQLDAKVTLIDSPGVVFEGASEDASVVLRNVVRVENVIDPLGIVEALVAKAPREAVLKFYGLSEDFKHVNEFLIHVARTKGKLIRGSGLDLPSAARTVISDWTTGKFRYFVLPAPEEAAATAKAAEETAEIVSALAPRLDIDAMLDDDASEPVVLGAPSLEEWEDAMDESGEQTVEVDMG